jgi:hypothetical protein
VSNLNTSSLALAKSIQQQHQQQQQLLLESKRALPIDKNLNNNNNGVVNQPSLNENLNIVAAVQSSVLVEQNPSPIAASSSNSAETTASPSSSSSSYTPLSGRSPSTSHTNIFTSCLYIDKGGSHSNSNNNHGSVTQAGGNHYQQTKFEGFINNKLSSKV